MQQMLSRRTLVEYVGDVGLSDFVSKLSEQRVQQQSTVSVGLTVHGVSLHHHLRPAATLSYVLEQLPQAQKW